MKRSFSTKISLISLLCTLVLFHVFLIAQDVEPFLGSWKGEINSQQGNLEIIIKLTLDESKNIQGTIDVPAQEAVDIPLGDIQIEGKKITFKIVHPQVQGDPTFKGELDESGKKIAGDYTQGPSTTTFSIEKE